MCWRLVEDEPREIEKNEDDDGKVPDPTFSDMSHLKNWVHANPNILKNNRTTHLDPEEPPDVEDWDAEEEKKKIEAADPYAPRL